VKPRFLTLSVDSYVTSAPSDVISLHSAPGDVLRSPASDVVADVMHGPEAEMNDAAMASAYRISSDSSRCDDVFAGEEIEISDCVDALQPTPPDQSPTTVGETSYIVVKINLLSFGYLLITAL